MDHSPSSVALSQESLHAIQKELRNLRLDGWLLYDFRGSNPISGGLLGLPALSRRYFVYLPAEGRPIALTHRIEQQPWRGWIGENRVYLGWESFERELGRMLAGQRRVALEYSARDAVPYLDRVPGGILEVVRGAGVEPVSSGDLVSFFYSRWTGPQEESHLRAALVVQETALAAFEQIEERLRAGGQIGEWELRSWVLGQLERRGLRSGADAVVAIGRNAARPHYMPSEAEHAAIGEGEVVLIDLWGKENEEGIFADQTWMAYLGSEPPVRVQELWSAIRDARDAAVTFLQERYAKGEMCAGYEVDAVARSLLRERGLADAFVHRTGHSIDRELHGSGPNLDDLESRDERRLIPGVGFSVEPGVYFEGEIGLRTEINVFIGAAGPVVTTPNPQDQLYRIEI